MVLLLSSLLSMWCGRLARELSNYHGEGGLLWERKAVWRRRKGRAATGVDLCALCGCVRGKTGFEEFADGVLEVVRQREPYQRFTTLEQHRWVA
jgi:hypothetical protein